jgi:hypothetical protein
MVVVLYDFKMSQRLVNRKLGHKIGSLGNRLVLDINITTSNPPVYNVLAKFSSVHYSVLQIVIVWHPALALGSPITV